MRNEGLVVVVVFTSIVLSACGFDAEARQRENTAYAHRISNLYEAKKRAEAEKNEADERAAALPEEKRRKALAKRAIAAVELDGHPRGKELLKIIATCEDGFTEKCDHRWVAKDVSKVVYLAGISVREADPVKAEMLMVEAEKLAQKNHADRTAKAEKLKAEDEAIQADLKACAADQTPCVERCKQDPTSSACVALGIYTITTDTKDDRFDRALGFFAPACNAGMEAACGASKKATKERDVLLRPVNEAWSNLVAIGDDLATKKFLHAFAGQNFKGAKNAAATQRMGLHIQEMTKDYCVAAKDFLKVSTKAELAKRAKTHCADDPPTSSGLGGNQVELKAECAAVYATSCP